MGDRVSLPPDPAKRGLDQVQVASTQQEQLRLLDRHLRVEHRVPGERGRRLGQGELLVHPVAGRSHGGERIAQVDAGVNLAGGEIPVVVRLRRLPEEGGGGLGAPGFLVETPQGEGQAGIARVGGAVTLQARHRFFAQRGFGRHPVETATGLPALRVGGERRLAVVEGGGGAGGGRTRDQDHQGDRESEASHRHPPGGPEVPPSWTTPRWVDSACT